MVGSVNKQNTALAVKCAESYLAVIKEDAGVTGDDALVVLIGVLSQTLGAHIAAGVAMAAIIQLDLTRADFDLLWKAVMDSKELRDGG